MLLSVFLFSGHSFECLNFISSPFAYFIDLGYTSLLMLFTLIRTFSSRLGKWVTGLFSDIFNFGGVHGVYCSSEVTTKRVLHKNLLKPHNLHSTEFSLFFPRIYRLVYFLSITDYGREVVTFKTVPDANVNTFLSVGLVRNYTLFTHLTLTSFIKYMSINGTTSQVSIISQLDTPYSADSLVTQSLFTPNSFYQSLNPTTITSMDNLLPRNFSSTFLSDLIFSRESR